MAKTKFDLENMFGKIGKSQKTSEQPSAAQPAVQPVEQPISQPTVASVDEQPATVAVEMQVRTDEKQDLQGKQGKLAKQGKQGKSSEPKKYDYGTKHTFAIPDDLWEDALIVMQLQGASQVEYLVGLIKASVDANKEAISVVKGLRGGKK